MGEVSGQYEVLIGQRGAALADLGREARPTRPQRTARLELRSARIRYAREIEPPDPANPLEWMILTSEPVDTLRQAKTVISYYECRWLVEEFHKAWKTGLPLLQRMSQCACCNCVA